MPRKATKLTRLDFENWNWGEYIDEAFTLITSEIAATLTDDLHECLSATFDYDEEHDDLVIKADLAADAWHDVAMEATFPLVEAVTSILESEAMRFTEDAAIPVDEAFYVPPDCPDRPKIECMARTFSMLALRLQRILDRPEPEANKAYRLKRDAAVTDLAQLLNAATKT